MNEKRQPDEESVDLILRILSKSTEKVPIIDSDAIGDDSTFDDDLRIWVHYSLSIGRLVVDQFELLFCVLFLFAKTNVKGEEDKIKQLILSSGQLSAEGVENTIITFFEIYSLASVADTVDIFEYSLRAMKIAKTKELKASESDS